MTAPPAVRHASRMPLFSSLAGYDRSWLRGDVLASIHHELGAKGVALWLAGVRGGLLEMLVRSGLADAVGRAHLYRNVEDATGDVSA
jgi:STAS domain-containing protein